MDKKKLIKEFTETYCKDCNSYIFCGGECRCVIFENFLKENTKNNK